MVLSGVPRSGKSTFWKRIAINDFHPSEKSRSTVAAESHYISAVGREKPQAHVHSEMLFDLHLHSEDRDLDSEALTIYKLLLERHKSQAETDIVQAMPIVEPQASKYELLPMLEPRTFSDLIVDEINKYFERLNDLLLKSKNLSNILNIKKLCHLQDNGGQRAFLELLPTLSTGKALYLIFFSYRDFQKSISETVQIEGNPKELVTGIQYQQIDVIMQSLICIATASAGSSDNVALLVGTHVDSVTAEDVNLADNIIYERVKPFLLNYILVPAKSGGKENLVLKVAINENGLCSNDPKDYVNVIMNIVDRRLQDRESAGLPASWFMFYIMLRRLQSAGYSVLRYRHCQQIAEKLYIQQYTLQNLLSRLQSVFGIVLWFPEVKELRDVVICNPAFVYRSISELIFESFLGHSGSDMSLLIKLKKLGMFEYQDLQKYCKIKQYLELYELIIVLKHLGIIAPIGRSNTAQITDSEYDESDNEDIELIQEYVIPCVLKEAPHHELDIQLKNTQACSIVPLRIYFDCGFAPMGGFCYLFTKLVSGNKGWKLCIPDNIWEDANSTYWRNKVTFKVKFDSCDYLVTLLSTDVYYEIHIIHSRSKTPFQLLQDGHNICRHVWKTIHTLLEKSLNRSLQAYKVACICTIETNKHVMKFKCKPHENLSNIKAYCEECREYPPLDMQPSVMVWFKVR